jgi:hypothetical protein
MTGAGVRADALRGRYPFAAEMLTLYLALLEVWEESRAAARVEQPEDVAEWAAQEVVPRVVEVSHEAGPSALKAAFSALNAPSAAFTACLSAWLSGQDLPPLERYLARASLRGPLSAVDAGVACAGDPSPRGDRRCPRCGGPPQLSFRSDTGDQLASGHRKLQCARCAESWNFSSSTCAYCGETTGGKRTVYSEHRDGPNIGRRDAGDATFPHLRIEACTSCRRYLIDVDLGRDPRAVPEVDELAALPLDLYAAEQGLTKITPNVMGF